MTHYFIGDLHFGHEKVSNIRGFASTDEHDDHIVESWLQTVRKDDIVTVMGDISSGTKAKELRALALLDSLPGFSLCLQVHIVFASDLQTSYQL